MKNALSKAHLDKLRKIVPQTIAKELTSVQPMSGPARSGSTDPYEFFDWITESEWSEWHKTFLFWPQRSISGKLIVGRVNVSARLVRRPPSWWEKFRRRRLWARIVCLRKYASDKELFVENLKGNSNQ